MKLLDTIKNFFDHIDQDDFYKYTAIFLFSITLITGGILFQYYRTVTALVQQIEDINDQRGQVRIILGKLQQVQQQRDAVDRMLAEEQDFKIGGYFTDLINSLNLENKLNTSTTRQIDREDEYRESTLQANFTNMSTQQLTELLSKLEQNKRIYTKDLEITKSKKRPNTIEVALTIGTLQLQKEQPE